ncbi:MAG: hypothetical protein HY461_03135 [Parcubacteria group bacterium]|nr:hypothetical protein [Parcubacteria group bacterium]
MAVNFANFATERMDQTLRYPIIPVLLFLLIFAGFSCRSAQKPQENPQGNGGSVNVYGAEDKGGYADNIAIKIEDLRLHIGKIIAERPNVEASRLPEFDASVVRLEDLLGKFEAAYEAFKASALEEFLPERSKLNDLLVELEDFYLKTITDFKFDFTKP